MDLNHDGMVTNRPVTAGCLSVEASSPVRTEQSVVKDAGTWPVGSILWPTLHGFNTVQLGG